MRNIATKQGKEASLLFVAELNGFKEGTVDSKLAYGMQCYESNKLHPIDLDTESGRKELHENIWLERIYAELAEYDNYVIECALAEQLGESKPEPLMWSVPLELDAAASMIGYEGCLLGDERLLTMTNMHGSTLSDPWHLEGMSRLHVKSAATPLLYGSSQTVSSLWQDKKLDYTLDQLKIFQRELNTGALGLANDFKEFIIRNCKPKETMQVEIWNDKFTIECNRFTHIGDVTVSYSIYDSVTGKIKTIHHTKTKNVADLDQFRTYFVTLLIHCLDSQVASNVAKKVYDKYQWVLDIHDAFIVCPEAASDVRKWYAEEMDKIYSNRQDILARYFKSIGIGPEANAQWLDLQDKVKPVANFKCQPMVLK